MPDKFTSDSQSVLDELWEKSLIPFKLTAQEVKSLGAGEYIIRFCDSRLRSLDFSSNTEQSFKTAVRNAVLERVKRMSGPLRKTAH